MTQSMSSIDCEEGRERVKKNVGVCVRMTDGDWDRGDYGHARRPFHAESLCCLVISRVQTKVLGGHEEQSNGFLREDRDTEKSQDSRNQGDRRRYS